MKKSVFGKKTVIGLALGGLLAATPLAFASSAEHGGGGHGGDAGVKAKSASEVMQMVLQGNNSFKGHHDSHYFDAYQTGQVPSLTIITCSDSRVHTPLFGMEPNNNIFAIRNIGNQIKNSEGSVDYGVRHLPTRVLLVMGHSGCGAIKAAMGDYSGETTGIRHELDPLEPALKADSGEGVFNVRWAQNVERNVDYQVAYAMELYADKVAAGELAVVGGVYDFNDLYGRGRGTLVITNIGGETDPQAMMGLPLLKDLSKAEIVSHVGSLAP